MSAYDAEFASHAAVIVYGGIDREWMSPLIVNREYLGCKRTVASIKQTPFDVVCLVWPHRNGFVMCSAPGNIRESGPRQWIYEGHKTSHMRSTTHDAFSSYCLVTFVTSNSKSDGLRRKIRTLAETEKIYNGGRPWTLTYNKSISKNIRKDIRLSVKRLTPPLPTITVANDPPGAKWSALVLAALSTRPLQRVLGGQQILKCCGCYTFKGSLPPF